ncbi:unnamed protein product [Blepharisma stoltei]|uniref:Cathepsin propeptide inhibitor domain-containing protein n=1 Tax=Blepharisma stoltei TaxID=1481888 RepID=A0AAU9JSM9_9CILI|nr:unnamed protein product [Blepharisma stoltei]
MDSYLRYKHNPSQSKKSLILFSSLFFIGILFAVFALKSSFPSKSRSLSQFELDQEQFKSFILTYNKNYPTPEEFLKRFQIFRENLAHFQEFNSQRHSWTKGITKFADMTVEEFHEKYSRPMEKVEIEHYKEFEVGDTIFSWDWRNVPGILTPIKDQHTCANCYAFASAATVESAWAISGKGLHSLSVQQITDCSLGFGNHGCNTGSYIATYGYIKNMGLSVKSIILLLIQLETAKKALLNIL